MSTVIWTSTAALALLVMIATHEAGHAWAMRRYGIPIEEAGLGLPYAPRVVLPATRRRPFRLSLSPWILGAYVTPAKNHAQRLANLPYIDQAWINGAGIAVNTVTGCGLAAVLAGSDHNWTTAAVFAAAGLAIAAWPRHFCAFVAPALGIPATALTAWSLFRAVGQPAGPVGTAQALRVNTLFGAVAIAMAVAFALAILNVLPLYPFDGGRIAGSIAKRWGGARAGRVFERVGGLLALGLVGYCISTDLWWIATG